MLASRTPEGGRENSPPATSASGRRCRCGAGLATDQLGIRVPALLVSPWAERKVEKTQFDHTSLLKYLTQKWQLRALPSKRMEEANSISVAIGQELRDDGLPRIELTRDQLTPPKLELEELAIGHDSAHDSALKRLRDHLWLEFDEEGPDLYAKFTHIIDRVKAYCEHPESAKLDSRTFSVSIAEPDKLGTADVSVKDDIARWLMHKKQRSVAVLAEHIRDDSLSEDLRRHAARTLELISGRRFHHDGKLEEAQKLLDLHGQ